MPLLFCSQNAWAQVASDVLDWHRYFPMEAGNIWEFVGDSEAYRLEITGDTTRNGATFFHYRATRFDEHRRFTGRRTGEARYDTSGTVIGLHLPGPDPSPLFPDCIDLGADFGSSLSCDSDSLQVESIYPHLRIRGDTYAVPAIKKFESDSLVYIYAADVGPASWRMERNGAASSQSLFYANVGVRIYGTATLPAVGPDAVNWHRYFPLAVGNECSTPKSPGALQSQPIIGCASSETPWWTASSAFDIAETRTARPTPVNIRATDSSGTTPRASCGIAMPALHRQVIRRGSLWISHASIPPSVIPCSALLRETSSLAADTTPMCISAANPSERPPSRSLRPTLRGWIAVRHSIKPTRRISVFSARCTGTVRPYICLMPALAAFTALSTRTAAHQARSAHRAITYSAGTPPQPRTALA